MQAEEPKQSPKEGSVRVQVCVLFRQRQTRIELGLH